jgi:two-component system response regulator TrcR
MTEATLLHRKVLLVDDNQLASEAMQMVLEGDGFEVDAADNAKQALASFKISNPNIVITDIVMPDMDGLEFIRSIRQLGTGVPILAISGMESEDGRSYLNQAEKLGADICLSKPVSRVQLLESVRYLLATTSHPI